MDEKVKKEIDWVSHINSFLNLEKGWEAEGISDPPSKQVCDTAISIVTAGLSFGLDPSVVTPSVEDGIVIEYYGIDKRYFLFECFNSGEIILLWSKGLGDPRAGEITSKKVFSSMIWIAGDNFLKGLSDEITDIEGGILKLAGDGTQIICVGGESKDEPYEWGSEEKEWTKGEPISVISELEIIANRAQSELDMVEAKLRIHVLSLPIPIMAESPEPLEQVLQNLSSEGIRDGLIDQIRKLVCVALRQIKPDLEADISISSQDVIEIIWRGSPFEVRWLIAPSRIKWPGVNVRAVCWNGESVEHRSFWTVHTLMEHFSSLLKIST